MSNQLYYFNNNKGERGSKFYIILEGKVGIFIKNKSEMKKVKELQGGEGFGELALINDAPRSASIKCMTECHFAVLDKKNYITLFQQILDNEIKKEVSYYPEIELFSNWNYNKIKSFYNHSFRIKVKKGDKLISESDPIDAIYIIVAGEFVVKKKLLNESNIFHKRGDLQQLKRQNLSMQTQSGQRVKFLIPFSENYNYNYNMKIQKLDDYQIENVEEEDPKFCYSVECYSFEGSLIYIKLQDYMKIIMKDEAQREYMQNYSIRRMQRVQNRLKEVSTTLNAQSINDENNDLQAQFERNISNSVSISVIAAQLQNGDAEQNPLQERNTKPEQIRRTMKKRKTCIDALGNENTISKSNDSQQTYAIFHSEIDDSLNFSPQISSQSSQAMKGNHLNHQTSQSLYNQQRSLSEFSQARGGEQQIQTSKSSIPNSQAFNSSQILKVKTKFANPYSPNTSSQGNGNTSNNTKLDDSFSKTNTPISLNASNLCYTPVSYRKNNSFATLKKGNTLSNFSEQAMSPLKLYQTNKQSPIVKNSSQIDIQDEEKHFQNVNPDNRSNKLTISIDKNQNNFKKQFTQSAFSMKFYNDIDEDDEQEDNQDQDNESQTQIKNNKSIPTLSFIKPQQKEEVKQNKQIRKQNSQIENPEQDYEQLHPLVKGFHEQLKVRFYNKFKHGSIEDLKSHMAYSPIQSLQPDAVETETINNLIRPAIFSNKKMKESRTKELRDYEQKLKQLIKSDSDVGLDAISPLKPKFDKAFYQKQEIGSPIINSHIKLRDPNRILKKSLINLFQNTSYKDINIDSSLSQIGGSLLKQQQQGDKFSGEKTNQLLSKHMRVGSLDSVFGIPKFVNIQSVSKEGEFKEEHMTKQIQNISCLPTLNQNLIKKANLFPIKKSDQSHLYLGQAFKQNLDMKTVQFTPNNNKNDILTPKDLKYKIVSTSQKMFNSTREIKQNQLFVSNRVGFKGQKGFNCSQFNLRKDKLIFNNM